MSQCAVPIACQIPFKFGLPSAVLGTLGACARASGAAQIRQRAITHCLKCLDIESNAMPFRTFVSTRLFALHHGVSYNFIHPSQALSRRLTPTLDDLC